ncbi:phosphopentomutase [Mediterraneibacter glycyrrhizinilyticus]|uniref:phosphopentomutase n=1 Tax=Mediterraneibacter glycyrrhizinilyticus TaxID=342942 RepID=UPI00196165A4|nr:phosphopentomutase [Mediterraneibacter glycyrrhizinilyticus]MBM6751738.1 phosphopentomutase [Mediterraneibacter glycyrrhizinilyticus]
MAKRVFLIVLDSAGVGYEPDADRFGDVGSDTFGTCIRSGRLSVPNMEKMGLYQIEGTSFEKEGAPETGCCGKLREQSAGKDTTMGHWEIGGVISPKPMPTYPNGFPKELLDEFAEKTGRGVICNEVGSGTEMIRKYGEEQMRTGKWIVYTSADSVFQIAAHEEVIPLEELYEGCRIARKMLTGENAVGRVIARPYVGEAPNFTRTVNRHDFSLEPPKDTILDMLKAAGKDVIGVGKIYDIFAGRGLTKTFPNEGNEKNMDVTISLLDEDFDGLCFVNLVDFDMLYGHRNDIKGYTDALNAFDKRLDEFLPKLREDDLLMITADHGCDPGFPGTDHTREYVPILCCGKKVKSGVNLGTRESYADISATIAELFGIRYTGDGESFLSEIM